MLNEGQIEHEDLPKYIKQQCTNLSEPKQLVFSEIIHTYWDAKDDLEIDSKDFT